MKTFNNEISIHRGETFTLDFEIKNPDGTPYVISKRLAHPYMLLAVTKYRYQLDDTVYNHWIDVGTEQVRFNSTNIANYATLVSPSPTTWGTTPPIGYEGDANSYANESVFYLDVNGVREYRYFEYTNSMTPAQRQISGDYSGTYKTYIFHIVVPFQHAETVQWDAQNYLYSVSLLDGDNTDTNPPIENFSTVIPILPPTKLVVYSDLKGAF